MDRIKKAWINIGLFIITLAINTLGALGFINGYTQKQISDMYVTLITPSPMTFSIWSVIYTLLLISLIALIVKREDSYYGAVLDRVSLLFWISCIFNIAWIVSFSFVLVEISVVFIVAFVITLALICQQLLKLQDKRRRLLPITFGFYTGWLTIATVVNIAAALVKVKWDRFGIAEEIWAIAMLVVAVVLVALILLRIRNAAYPLPLAWAYLGIYLYLSSPDGFNGAYGILQIVALAGMVVLIGLAAIQFYRNRYCVLPIQSSGAKRSK
ncbi:MAG: tryptophan-rich sensory protein [Coriobacteriaceae bacterium]|nr:tryptophan-rich sensory protein [Coriobacteriaceae bacterium]